MRGGGSQQELLLGARLVSTSVTSLAARGVPVANSSEAFAGLGCCSGKAKRPWLGQVREAASLPSARQNGHHAGGGCLGGLQSPRAWAGSGWLCSPWSHPPFPAKKKTAKKACLSSFFLFPSHQDFHPSSSCPASVSLSQGGEKLPSEEAHAPFSLVNPQISCPRGQGPPSHCWGSAARFGQRWWELVRPWHHCSLQPHCKASAALLDFCETFWTSPSINTSSLSLTIKRKP